MRVFDRFWSCLPYLRPMATVIGDSINYGIDPDGAGCHDLLGTRCDPYVHKLLTGAKWEVCCHSNLVCAVLPYRLHESDIHDVLNVFQVTGLTRDRASVFRQTLSRAAGRLLRILCRNRLALRPLRLSHWGYVRGDLGTAGWRPIGGMPPTRRRRSIASSRSCSKAGTPHWCRRIRGPMGCRRRAEASVPCETF